MGRRPGQQQQLLWLPKPPDQQTKHAWRRARHHDVRLWRHRPTAAGVGNAILHIRQDFSSFPGLPNTWNIVGIAADNTGWDTNTMSWNDINGGAAGDWTGGTLGGSLFGSYGTFQDLGTNVDGNIAINLTSAFQAFLNGTISGIAFVDSTNGDTFNGIDYFFSPYSNDSATATNRPGLLVTAIPEPSTALLGCLGVLALLRRRR